MFPSKIAQRPKHLVSQIFSIIEYVSVHECYTLPLFQMQIMSCYTFSSFGFAAPRALKPSDLFRPFEWELRQPPGCWSHRNCEHTACIDIKLGTEDQHIAGNYPSAGTSSFWYSSLYGNHGDLCQMGKSFNSFPETSLFPPPDGSEGYREWHSYLINQNQS